MDDLKLVSLVQRHEELYDVLHRKYSDNLYKDNTWRAIGAEMNQAASHCKSRWFSLRDQYRKAIRIKRAKFGSGSDSRRWKYEEEMSFLMPHLQDRDTTLSLTYADDNSNNCGDQDPLGSPRSPTWEADGDPVRGRLGSLRRGGENLQSSRVEDEGRRKKKGFSRDSASAVLFEHILSRREQKPDKIDAFFSSMAATVKTFSPIRQNLVKSRIFSIVSEMELEQLMEFQQQA